MGAQHEVITELGSPAVGGDDQAAKELLNCVNDCIEAQQNKTGKVTGIGGVFFQVKGDEKVLADWYEKNLGMDIKSGFAVIQWSDDKGEDKGQTAWKVAKDTSTWFAPSKSDFMINYRVDNLDAIHERLKKNGAEIVQGPEDYDYGRFLRVMDPDGNKLELWEPKQINGRKLDE